MTRNVNSRGSARRVLMACLCLATTSMAAAQTPPPATPAPIFMGADDMSAAQRKCWSSTTALCTRTNVLEPLAVSFGNLANGMSVRSPFWIDFGVRGMGVIPAGNAHAKAGHHHLLINTPLPKTHNAKIPFNNNHRHFGKGQTGVLLDLPPGTHTLRLLFADHDHRPYFVFSPEITITVSGKQSDPAPAVDSANFEASCAAWYANEVTQPRGSDKHVFVRNLRANEAVGGAFKLGLGVVGYGVAPAGSNVKDTGYFVIDVAGRGRNQKVELRDGRTEAGLELPPGDYSLIPRLFGHDGKLLLSGAALPVQVGTR
jgi:hypothetical protein